ncbi:MAG: MerR family DNA-binding transcriptional regulator [Gammaproteobacteria bacterium]|nr:MerR family DNA-binding transcriptional regulator [Gammaproteobacteria bacterium]
MLTVTQLAKKFGISRATILYYEQKGLLLPSTRSENGYRWYGVNEVKVLETIMAYRSFGIPIVKLTDLINRKDDIDQERILRDQFSALEKEILTLRQQQKAIVQLLKQPTLLEQKMVTKDRWVEIMKAAGLSDQDMMNWHKKFEAMEPTEHQKFLESLNIDPDEITKIRGF